MRSWSRTWSWRAKVLVLILVVLVLVSFSKGYLAVYSRDVSAGTSEHPSKKSRYLTLCVLYEEHTNGCCVYGTSVSYDALVP